MTDTPQGGATPDAPVTDAAKNQGDEPKTFTQEDLDRIVQDRLSRERAKYADFDEIKTKAAEFDKLKDSQKSELEKAADARTAAERERDQAVTDLQSERIRSAVYVKAADAKVNPTAAHRLIDQKAIGFDKDGLPTEESVKAAFDTMLESFPELTSPTRPQGRADGGARGTAPATGPDEEFAEAVKSRLRL